MYTIVDYLKYYGNICLNDVHWNDMDNLVCAILAYLPVESFSGIKSMNDFYDYTKKYEINQTESVMVPKAYEILNLVYSSKRYSSMKMFNFNNIRTDSIQFGAVTFRIKGNTIISFKGTDGSIIGWIENFRVGYEYLTNTHKLAIKYLNNNVNYFLDQDVYVVGHSKGGNLAMVSSMETSDIIFNKIKKVYNFDGPGLMKREYDSQKYKRLTKKLINIIPTGSVIGVLLNNNNYQVVKSNNLATSEHYPTSFCIFGECFVGGKLSKISNHLHESTTKGLENLDSIKVRNSFEAIFNSLEKEYSSKFNIKLEDIIVFYKNFKKIDPEVSGYFDDIFNSMINVVYRKSE